MSQTSPRLGREALLRQRRCRRRSKASRIDRRFPLRNHRNKARRRNPILRNPSRGNPLLSNSLPCRSTLYRVPLPRNLLLRNLLLRNLPLRNLPLRNLLLGRSPPRSPLLRNVPRGSHPRRCRRPGDVPCKRPRSWTLFRKNPGPIILLPRHLHRSSPPGRIHSRWTRLRWGLHRQRPRRAALRSGGRGRPFTIRAACTAAAPGTRSSRRSGVPPLR